MIQPEYCSAIMNSLKKLFPKPLASWSVFVLIVIVAAFAPQHLSAQGYGSIVGTVTDATSAVVSGAQVTATQTDTGRQTTVTSGQTGEFVFPSLSPAGYSLEIISGGFQKFEQKGIVLQADQTVTVKAKMTIGAATETVEVTSQIPQVDTTSGTLSQVIDQTRVVDLPLNGRNAAALVTLVAGIVVAPGNGLDQGSTKTFPAAVSVSANGVLPNQSNYFLNGGNNLDEMTNVNGPFPFPDALQEFSVQTSNYSAEFGQAAGAVVNIVTKSGGRKFHGSAFEFLRNGYFNAKPYFAPTADSLHRHQFGGTIGGPILIPHISTGTRTQFFFGYQHTLIHANSSQNVATVPTLAAEGLTASGSQLGYADFGNLCTAGYDANNICTSASQRVTNPFTNVVYPLNRIPSSAFDPASVLFEQHIPTFTGTPAVGAVGGPVNFFKPTTQAFNEYIARVDHSFSDSDHLFGHYYYNDFDQLGIYDPKNLLSYASYSNVRYQNALLSETHTFTSHLLNSLVVNYQREVSLRGGPPGSPDITAFGVQNIWQPAVNNVINSVGVTGYFSVSASAYAAWLRNNYSFNDDIHWVKGSHNIAFGGHFELSKFDVTNVFSSFGTFGFNSSAAYPNALANYQMGYLTSFGQGNFELVNDRNHFPGIYAQDSWKASARLTLNYGLRWESFAPWANRIGQQTVFSPSAYASNKGSTSFSTLPAGMLLSGDPGIAKNGLNSKYAQFMPRVGFAYDLFGDGRTVVRGGAGIFYQNRMPGFFNLNQAGDVPNTITVGTANAAGTAANPGGPFSNPYCTGCATGQVTNPFPFTLPFPSNKVFPNKIFLAEFDPSGNFQVPVTDDYNLTVERQISGSWSARVAYVGSVSRHQFVNLEINPEVNNGAGGTDLRRPYNTAPIVAPCTTTTGCATSYSQIVLASMSGSADYNSLQATVEKKMSKGLSMLANYTFSRSLDDMPFALRVGNTEDLNAGESYVLPLYPAGASTWNPTDYKALDRGLSDIDHTHVFSFSYVYNLPKLHEGFRALQALTNGWRTSGLIQHHSGDALTAYASADISLTGLGQDRAQQSSSLPMYLKQQRVGYCQAGKNCVNWLNPGAFSLPTNAGPNTGTGFGNVVKGSLRGPGYTNWDAAVIRSFPIYRETNLDFRVEYFDVLNHTILNNPSTASPKLGSTFGTITSENAAGPRIAQFSLKYVF